MAKFPKQFLHFWQNELFYMQRIHSRASHFGQTYCKCCVNVHSIYDKQYHSIHEKQYHLHTKDETRQHWWQLPDVFELLWCCLCAREPPNCHLRVPPICRLTLRYFQIFLVILVTAVLFLLFACFNLYHNWIKPHHKYKQTC